MPFVHLVLTARAAAKCAPQSAARRDDVQSASLTLLPIAAARRGLMWLGAAALVTVLAASAGMAHGACEAGAGVRRVDGKSVALTFTTQPAPIKVGEMFTVNIVVCPKQGAVERLKVDAGMPEHKHGMNYQPVVKKNPGGDFTATGLMFHMPGRWQFVFDVDTGNGRERLLHNVAID